jgi:hypothetical protein
MTTKHSFLPPSGASAWSLCPQWPTMNARYPDSNTAESEEGTAAHWVMSEMLDGRSAAEDTLAPNGVVVTGEMIEGGQMVRDVVVTTINTHRAPLHIEETVKIQVVHQDCFGTPDVWSYDPAIKQLNIIDYKFGHRFVDEYWNLQGLLYMAGIVSLFAIAPNTVSFTVIQPRCYYRGEPIRTHTYKMLEASSHLEKLRAAAILATQPNPTATTGTQCEHCPGRHACPTLQRAAYSDAETSTDQQPVDLTPQAAALELKMLDRALLRLTARVDGLRELTLTNIRAGKQVPHYKAENGRGRLSWKVKPEEVITLGKIMGKDLSVPKVITPTQAKQLLLDDTIIARYADVIPGALRLVESDVNEATRVFKKET